MIKDPEVLANIKVLKEEAAKRKRLDDAAPAMLEALEELIEEFDRKVKEYENIHPMCFLTEPYSIQLAKEAIAQAKGEERTK